MTDSQTTTGVSDTPPIVVKDLTRRYGSQLAVDNVSFQVEAGNVTGFLGPNGAGKSTTMKMLVGLAAPTSGHTQVLGVPYQHLKCPGRQVGVLLDASAQHSGRTGREVLTLGAMLMGLPGRRVDEMLELVGLGGAAEKRVGNYSLGMRQRLGIGHAMLGEPRVLILDEPANGLDPSGIRWMRELLRDFADRGGSVLLSSHLLHEVELIADHLVIIGRGRILKQGPLGALVEATGVAVRSLDQPGLTHALIQAGIGFTRDDEGWFLTTSDAQDVVGAAAASSVVLSGLRLADSKGLENLYHELTTGNERHDADTWKAKP